MWPVFPPKDAIAEPLVTTTIIKHIHEYLPPTESIAQQTAVKTVTIATAALFLKLWITTSMEGMYYRCLCMPDDLVVIKFYVLNRYGVKKTAGGF